MTASRRPQRSAPSGSIPAAERRRLGSRPWIGTGGAVLLGLCVAFLVTACASPPPASDASVGSVAEMRELLRASSIAPVVAGVTDREETGAVEQDPQESTVDPAQEAAEALPAPALTDEAIEAELAALEAEVGEELPEAVAETSLDDPDALPAPGLGGGASGPDGGPPAPNPYVEFGERIEVRADGRITKPFVLPPGKGKAMLQLMALAASFDFTQATVAPDAPQLPAPAANEDPDVADIVLLERWDFELTDDFNRPSQAAPKPPQKIDLADWLVVTSSAATMREVESFMELFAGRVPQIEITASIVEVTFSDELDYGVTGPDGNVVFDFPEGTFFDSLAYSVPNTVEGVEAVLSIGAIQDGVALNAFLEAIQRWENVEIKTNPRIVVREGGTAEILNLREVAIFNFTNVNLTGNFNASLKFKEIGTRLFITPRVVGSDTLALNMYLEVSQQVGTSVAFSDQEGTEFRAPVIAKRQARTTVYLKPDQAVAIGGLDSEREEEAESKVPILGDIPLIGWLFKSTRKRTEKTSVMFLIRPRVLVGTDFDEPFWEGRVLTNR